MSASAPAIGGTAEQVDRAFHESRPAEPGGALIVPGTPAGRTGTIVMAAIDDDDNAGRILAYAREWAVRLRTPLRVVHVWNGPATRTYGPRRSPRERMADGDRLVSDAISAHVPPDAAPIVERQILHDRDPARALRALSREAVLLVVAASSRRQSPEGTLGDTTRRLVGHTWCPMAIVPTARTRTQAE